MSSLQYKGCNNGCGKLIYFGDLKAPSGKSIPMEKGTKDAHQCPNSDFNMRKDKSKLGESAVDYVVKINNDFREFKAQTALRIEKLELSRWDFTTDDKLRSLQEQINKITGINFKPNTTTTPPETIEKVYESIRKNENKTEQPIGVWEIKELFDELQARQPDTIEEKIEKILEQNKILNDQNTVLSQRLDKVEEQK